MRLRQMRSFLFTFLIFAVALTLSAMLIVQTRANSPTKSKKQSMLSPLENAAAVQAVAQNNYKPNIRLWVHGDSIRPSMIRTRPGLVVLRVENETRSDVSLVIEKVLPDQTVPVGRITAPNSGKRARRELGSGTG